MLAHTLIVSLATLAIGQTISPQVRSTQDQAYQQLCGVEFEWRFEQLPTKGGVPQFRVPYSGYIYPDATGGTSAVLRKYDVAFHNGQLLATAYEDRDASSQRERVPGLVGMILPVTRIPDWHGHCNGWTAAAIRHAEPQYDVERNGVTFTPSDIKGLLAELYIYNRHAVLDGENSEINAGVFHAVVANWIGRQELAIGIDGDPSKEIWNFPAYSYAAAFAKRANREVEVTLNLVYAKDSNDEWNESPRIKHVRYFHYVLTLNSQGEIVGGRFLPDSGDIDLLWVPLSPQPSGSPGNEAGNPYLDSEQVLSIWRDSVPGELRDKWVNVDPGDDGRAPFAYSSTATDSTASPAVEVPAESPAHVVRRPVPSARSRGLREYVQVPAAN